MAVRAGTCEKGALYLACDPIERRLRSRRLSLPCCLKVYQRRQSVKAVCAPIGVAGDFDDSDAQIVVLRAHGRFGVLVAEHPLSDHQCAIF